MEQIKALVEKMNAEWVAFKAENDRRLKEIEAKGRADPLTEEKVNKHSTAIGELQAQIDDLTKKAQRKGGGTGGDAELDERKAEHSKAFNAFVRRGNDSGLRELQAAISVGSDADGGYLVPETLDTVIEKFERDNTPMRQLCKVMTVSNENYKKLIKSGDPSSGWVGEQEDRPTTNTPQWAELAPYFGEIYAKPKITQKALDDTMIDMEAEIGEDVGLEFAEQENDAYTRGNGVKKPLGILAYTMSTSVDGTRTLGQVQKVASGSSGAFTTDKLIDLVHALKRGYRRNAVWQISALGVAAIRKLKDGQNNYIWQGSFVPGQPEMLLGYPIEENDDVPVPAADALAAMFGDFRRAYTIIDVKGTRMLRDPFTDKPYVVFYTTKRVGGFLVNDRAVKVQVLT
jgi:HK97 family phage major capsid protein